MKKNLGLAVIFQFLSTLFYAKSHKTKSFQLWSMCFLLVFFMTSCASTSVNIKPESMPARDKLEEQIGKYDIYVGSMDSEVFVRTIKYMKEQILSNQNIPEVEKQKRIQYLDSLQWQENKFYWWTLRYRKQFSRKANDVTITILDPLGKKAGIPIFYENVKKKESYTVSRSTNRGYGDSRVVQAYADEYFDIRFYFMTDFPVVKGLAPADRVPLTVTGVFLVDQKTVHTLSPVQ